MVLLVHQVFQVMQAGLEKLAKKALRVIQAHKDRQECQEHLGCLDFQENGGFLDYR